MCISHSPSAFVHEHKSIFHEGKHRKSKGNTSLPYLSDLSALVGKRPLVPHGQIRLLGRRIEEEAEWRPGLKSSKIREPRRTHFFAPASFFSAFLCPLDINKPLLKGKGEEETDLFILSRKALLCLTFTAALSCTYFPFLSPTPFSPHCACSSAVPNLIWALVLPHDGLSFHL